MFTTLDPHEVRYILFRVHAGQFPVEVACWLLGMTLEELQLTVWGVKGDIING